MNKKIIIIVVIILVLAIGVAIPLLMPSKEIATYVVNFHSDDVTIVKSQIVQEGETVLKQSDPIKKDMYL